MSCDSLYYWKNFLNKDIANEVKPDSYILNFYIVNQNTSEVFNEWYPFDSPGEVLGFIKYVVLPSGYFSRIFGEENDDIFITADTYEGVFELLNNNRIRVDKTLIGNFKKDYSLLEKVEKKFALENLEQFCDSFNYHLDINEPVFSSLEVFRNIKDFGLQLVRDYEEQGMTDELEEQMEMSKEEILELFSNIQDYPFMLKRITEFLSSRLMIQ
ncbi:MAG: hypothetical protein ABRQ27_05150 [Clostridiaceae bacterium]